ncbi:MAG: nucleotidyltransferase family protein [Oscillospiraceae bacterium]|nr:nucleotidyltransferase family protein [Oscillospiraceae bacterium]
MTARDEIFLRLLRAAVAPGASEAPEALTAEGWTEVFAMAERHHVLPLVLDAAHRLEAEVPEPVFRPYQRRAMRLVSLQAAKTAAFLELYRGLTRDGRTPLVMKGLICRQLYPQPDFRFSADEDLLIPPDQGEAYHAALTARGMKVVTPERDPATAQEVGYASPDGLLYLEVHRYPFPPDSGAYGSFDDYFAGACGRAVTARVSGVDLKTLEPTDHLFYLVCHALKHFLHGGFGVRQACDICLFARAWRDGVDWRRLEAQLTQIRALPFTAAVFAVGRRLGLEPPVGAAFLKKRAVDPEPLLEDMLDAGVYGASTLSRRHSGGVTLGAVEGARRGASPRRGSVTRALFPPASSLAERYPFLKTRPALVPTAWLHRLVTYARTRGGEGDSAAEALRLGRQRTRLLRRYGLLPGAPDGTEK